MVFCSEGAGVKAPLHDRMSLYSLSWLDGSRAVCGAREFPRGARWSISYHDDFDLTERLVNAALSDPEDDQSVDV